MPNILIVDDTAVDRRLAGGLLQKDAGVALEYAENGVRALELMQQALPDVVVTDLQMPEMDGLELVTRVRMQFPQIPVILITAKGSEALAVEALEQGAASYVPKSQLADKLRDTVHEVLALSRSSRTYQRLMECQQRIEFSYILDNDEDLVNALVELAQQIVAGMGLCDHTGRFRMGIALREALLNALYRGNLEISFQQLKSSREPQSEGSGNPLVEQRRSQSPYRDRHIFVEGQISQQGARFVVRDEGPGFDHRRAVQERDLRALGSLDSSSGRGLVLMHAFLDEVAFNDRGNEVTLIKQRDVSDRSARA